MIRFQTEQTIERPANDIWAYAADFRRHPEWMGVTDARIVEGQGNEVGTRALEGVRLGPRKVQVEVVVAASVPGRRIAWTIAGHSPLAGDVSLDLESVAPDRTRAVYSGAIGLKGVWRLIEPLLAREVKAGEAAELVRLKDNVEGIAARS